MEVRAGREPGRPRHSLTRFLFASHRALRCGRLHHQMPPRLIEVLLEGRHTDLRPFLQTELGDGFMVSAGGEPDGSQVIILTGPDPDRVSMLRRAYPLSRIFVLESSDPGASTTVDCLRAGANGLLVSRSVVTLGSFVRALGRRLYGLTVPGESDGAEGMRTGPYIDENLQGGSDVG
jgi:hypothetical protein